MNAISKVRKLSATAALVLVAGMPIASHAAADARYIDSYNEGSEPPLAQPARQTNPQSLRLSSVAKSADAKSGADPWFELWDKDVTKASANPADAIPARKANEGHTLVGD